MSATTSGVGDVSLVSEAYLESMFDLQPTWLAVDSADVVSQSAAAVVDSPVVTSSSGAASPFHLTAATEAVSSAADVGFLSVAGVTDSSDGSSSPFSALHTAPGLELSGDAAAAAMAAAAISGTVPHSTTTTASSVVLGKRSSATMLATARAAAAAAAAAAGDDSDDSGGDEPADELLKMPIKSFQQFLHSQPLTADEEKALKKKRRLVKNRESAQVSRQRKKKYFEELHEQLEQQAAELGELRSANTRLASENFRLRQTLQAAGLQLQCDAGEASSNPLYQNGGGNCSPASGGGLPASTTYGYGCTDDAGERPPYFAGPGTSAARAAAAVAGPGGGSAAAARGTKQQQQKRGIKAAAVLFVVLFSFGLLFNAQRLQQQHPQLPAPAAGFGARALAPLTARGLAPSPARALLSVDTGAASTAATAVRLPSPAPSSASSSAMVISKDVSSGAVMSDEAALDFVPHVHHADDSIAPHAAMFVEASASLLRPANYIYCPNAEPLVPVGAKQPADVADHSLLAFILPHDALNGSLASADPSLTADQTPLFEVTCKVINVVPVWPATSSRANVTEMA